MITILAVVGGWWQQIELKMNTLIVFLLEQTVCNRPLSFILLSHSDSQSESTTKVYSSSKADVGGNVLTLTTCVLRSVRTESFWMPTDLVKCPVHSLRLPRKKLQLLAGRCRLKNNNILIKTIGVSSVRVRGGVGGQVAGGGEAICICDPSARDPPVCVCVCVCVCVLSLIHI